LPGGAARSISSHTHSRNLAPLVVFSDKPRGSAMSRPHATIVLGLLAISLAVVACGKPTTAAAEFSELHRVEIADASDLEVVMGLIKRHGESIGARHYHPGGEFAFILEGAVTVATEKQPPVTLEAGDSFYQPPGEWHAVSTVSEGSETVVFRVVGKGQPMVVPVD
jgi:quercetin dioxygenase-like cupin family protein